MGANANWAQEQLSRIEKQLKAGYTTGDLAEMSIRADVAKTYAILEQAEQLEGIAANLHVLQLDMVSPILTN